MVRLGSLCTGAGGLDMAVESVFDAETVWHCEIDAAASKVLDYRWPGVPNHKDLINTDWTSVEPIDVLCAGWPCQPFSLAGKRKGAEDERAIWPHIADAVRILRPRIVVLENVSAVLRVEFQRVADSLAALGYDLRWTCLRASDVGAPHRRERLFVVAHTNEPRPQGTQPTPRRNLPIRGVDAYPQGDGRHEGRPEPARIVRGSDVALRSDGPLELLPTPRASDPSNASSHSSEGFRPQLGEVARTLTQWGKYGPAICRWEQLTRPAPAPTELNTKGHPRLSPAFSEWLMGWPEGWVTQVSGISRNDQLRIVGNGVCPQQAHAALTSLLSVSEVAA